MRTMTVREEFVKKVGIANYAFEIAYGSTRADIVSKNRNTITTYEIKAEGDNFSKLERQISEYYEFSNFVYVIVPKMNQKSVENFLKKRGLLQVGVIIYVETENGLTFKKIRTAKRLINSSFNFEKAIINVPRYIIYEAEEETKGMIQREIIKFLPEKKLKKIWHIFINKKQQV